VQSTAAQQQQRSSSSVGAQAGGADVVRATARVTFWGALAMAATAGIGRLFGTVV
jgi:VIT1/CCC1 family predicted Fe2+/Mn2+ transporter